MGGDDIDINNVPDVVFRTSSRLKIPTHCNIISLASTMFENVSILGAPLDDVLAFIGFLYSPSQCISLEQTEVMDKYGMYLMVVFHVY